MTKAGKLVKLLTLWAVCLLISFLPMFGVSGGAYAAAETSDMESGIMQELSGLKKDGKPFSSEDYPADKNGTPQVLTAYEVGYSYYANKRAAYGLILYVYNPAQLNVQEDIRNTVQMKAGNAARYDKYKISIASESTDKLFYKFNVEFTEQEKTAVLSALDKDSRVYEISSIELYTGGYNATDYALPHTQIFTFTGYAAGLGQSSGEESTLSSTLSYTIFGGTETIPLNVHHTSWRPEGTNGKDEYTQDSICSVYFAVPNDLAQKYDYLNSVKCRWLEALTAPMLVTDCEEIMQPIAQLWAYQELMSNSAWGCEAPEEFDFSEFEYLIGIGNAELRTSDIADTMFYPDTLFGNDKLNSGSKDRYSIIPNDQLKTLFWLFQSEKNNTVSSATLLDNLHYLADKGYFINDKKVAGKYPSYLFESWDSEFRTETIEVGKTDNKLNLNSEVIEQTWWEKLFNKSHVADKTQYKKIRAIQQVTDGLISGGTTKEVCDRLYISERDYDDFIQFYDSNKSTATVYLLRFAVSDYTRKVAKIYKEQTVKWGWSSYTDLTEIKSRSYVTQETFYLDFDIIDLEYKKGDESYVIPVSMSPIDITPELTPPPFEEKGNFGKYAIITMVGLTVAYAVYKIGCGVAERARRGL